MGWYSRINDVFRETEFHLGAVRLSLLDFIQGLIILVLVFWFAAFLSRALERSLRHSNGLNYNTRELIVKFSKLFIYFIALMITLSAMGIDLTAFAVFGGALGVAIALGLQKITTNFVSGIVLLVEKSIKIGDLIEVGSILGWVRQLNIRYTLIETLDGRAILVPNDELLSTRVTSWTYTDNQARIEVLLKIDYRSDAKKACALMLEAAQAHPKCLKDPAPTCMLNEFTDQGIQLSLTFWIADVRDGRGGPRSDVMAATLEKFRMSGIEIAQPPGAQRAV